MNPTHIWSTSNKTTITPQERFFKKRPQTQQYVSLYLYYIIKFNVVPETNHTGQTDAAVRLQTHGPSKERKRQRKAQRVLKLRKGHRTWWRWWSDEYMSKGKQSETGWAMTWVNELSDRCRQRWWDDTERHKEKKYFIDICCYNFNDAGRGRGGGGGGTDWKGRGIPPPAQRVLYRHHSFFLSPNVKKAQTSELNHKMSRNKCNMKRTKQRQM